MTDLSHLSSILHVDAEPPEDGLSTPGQRRQVAERWAATALPLGICMLIWIAGSDATSEPTGLKTLHGAIVLSVMIWTGLRLARKPWTKPPAPPRYAGSRFALPRLTLLLLYALLILHPMLGVLSELFRGNHIVVLGWTVPWSLTANPTLAQTFAGGHAGNAILLLCLITVQLVLELRRRGAAVGGSSTTKSMAP